jgi:hypothetical protein
MILSIKTQYLFFFLSQFSTINVNLNGGYDIYRASKMPDVAAGSGGDS